MQAAQYAGLCQHVAPRIAPHVATQIGLSLEAHGADAGLISPLRIAHFIAQATEETEAFQFFTELGGPAYFDRYEGRRDLGNVKKGDGYLFRGRGIFMLTGRANYAAYGPRLGVDLIKTPGLAADPNIATFAACLYWHDHGCNVLADADDIEGVTHKINGGLNGIAWRKLYLIKAKAVLASMGELT